MFSVASSGSARIQLDKTEDRASLAFFHDLDSKDIKFILPSHFDFLFHRGNLTLTEHQLLLV